jgi:hypothetical protein
VKNIFLFALLLPVFGYTQNNVGIGTINPNPAAILELNSSDKGLLPPRLTLSERNSILNPPPGLIIFDATDSCLEYWNGAQWVCQGQSQPAKPDTIVRIDTVYAIDTTYIIDTSKTVTIYIDSSHSTTTTLYIADTGHSLFFVDTAILTAHDIEYLGDTGRMIVPPQGVGKFVRPRWIIAEMHPGSSPGNTGGQFKFFLDPLCFSNQIGEIPGNIINLTTRDNVAWTTSSPQFAWSTDNLGLYIKADYNPWSPCDGELLIIVAWELYEQH